MCCSVRSCQQIPSRWSHDRVHCRLKDFPTSLDARRPFHMVRALVPCIHFLALQIAIVGVCSTFKNYTWAAQSAQHYVQDCPWGWECSFVSHVSVLSCGIISWILTMKSWQSFIGSLHLPLFILEVNCRYHWFSIIHSQLFICLLHGCLSSFFVVWVVKNNPFLTFRSPRRSHKTVNKLF